MATTFDWVESTVDFFSQNTEYFVQHPLEFARLCATLPSLPQQRLFRSIICRLHGPRILDLVEEHEKIFVPHRVARCFKQLVQLGNPRDESVGALLLDFDLSAAEVHLLESLLHVFRRPADEGLSSSSATPR